ncbi:alpha amylase, all-beta domain protein [Cooperia oncophora]
MNALEEATGFLHEMPAYVSCKHHEDKNASCFLKTCRCAVRVQFPYIKNYKMVLNSDEERFGGHNRLQFGSEHHTFPEGWNGRRNHLCVYAPSRTCLVLRLK